MIFFFFSKDFASYRVSISFERRSEGKAAKRATPVLSLQNTSTRLDQQLFCQQLALHRWQRENSEGPSVAESLFSRYKDPMYELKTVLSSLPVRWKAKAVNTYMRAGLSAQCSNFFKISFHSWLMIKYELTWLAVSFSFCITSVRLAPSVSISAFSRLSCEQRIVVNRI